VGRQEGPKWPDTGSLLALYGTSFTLLGARLRSIVGVFFGASALTLALQYGAVVLARANQESDALASTLAYIVPIILYVIVGSLAAGAVAGIIASHLAGSGNVTIGTGVRAVRAVIKDALAASLLAALVCLLITFMTFFTTLLFLPFFYGPLLVIQTVVVQRLPFNQAIGRARGLARGSTGRVLGYSLMMSISAWVVPVAVIGLLEQMDPPGFPWAYAPLQVLIEGSAAALVAAAGTAMYFDLRMRREEYGAKELRAELA
jgi:hypothetical protein